MASDPPPGQGQDSTVDASLADQPSNYSTPGAHQPPPGQSFVEPRRHSRQRNSRAISRTQSVPGAIAQARQESPPPYPAFSENVLPQSPAPTAQHNNSHRAPSAPPTSRYENSYTQSSTIRDPRIPTGLQPDTHSALAQPASWDPPPTQRVTSNTMSATPETSSAAQHPLAGPSNSSAIRAPSSFGSSTPYVGSSSVASTAVRVGRDVPVGRLREVVHNDDKAEFVEFIGEVSKSAQQPLQRQLAKLHRKIDDVQGDIDTEVDRRYHEERTHAAKRSDPAMEERMRQLEERIRVFGKRPAGHDAQPSRASPTVKPQPKLLADATLPASVAPFAHNTELADELFAAQEQLREHEEAQRQLAHESAEAQQPLTHETAEAKRRSSRRPTHSRREHRKATKASRRRQTRRKHKSRRRYDYSSSSSCSDSICSSDECDCPRRPHDSTSSSDDEPAIAFAFRDTM